MTMEELQETLKELPQNSAVLLVNFTIDKNGRLFSSDRSAETISRTSPVPVYTLWDNYLSKGVLGGHLINAKAEGLRTARKIIQALLGEETGDMSVLSHFASQYVFDYQQLKRHGKKCIGENGGLPG